jgi:hypothetical protein
MRGNRLSVNSTKKQSQRDVNMVKGGKTRMFGKQAANKQKPGTTAHDVSGGAPGPSPAAGGRKKFSYSESVPATGGITGPR